MYVGVKVKLHASSILALDGGERSAWRAGRFNPGEKAPVPVG